MKSENLKSVTPKIENRKVETWKLDFASGSEKSGNLKNVAPKIENRKAEVWKLELATGSLKSRNLKNVASKIESEKVETWKLESEKQKRENFAEIRNFDKTTSHQHTLQASWAFGKIWNWFCIWKINF